MLAEYYDRLQAIRDHGEIEQWLEFFLEGVATVAKEATETARAIVELRESLRERVTQKLGRRSSNANMLLDHLFKNPFVNVRQVEHWLGISQPTAYSLVNDLERRGVQEALQGTRPTVVVLHQPACVVLHARAALMTFPQ